MGLHLVRLLRRDAVRVVKENEVDVRGIIELPAAELAKTEGNQPRTFLRIFGVRGGEGAPVGKPSQQHAEGGRAGRVGETGQCAGDRLEFPEPGDVRERDGDRRPPARFAQDPAGGFFVRIRRQRLDPGVNFLHAAVRAFQPKPAQEAGIADQAIAEERTRAEHAGKHGPAAGRFGERLGEVPVFAPVESSRRFLPFEELDSPAFGVTRIRPRLDAVEPTGFILPATQCKYTLASRPLALRRAHIRQGLPAPLQKENGPAGQAGKIPQSYALNELPQPQVEVTFGFSNLKPAPSIVST